MKWNDLKQAIGELGQHAPEVADGALSWEPVELLDQEAAWARIADWRPAEGWLTTTGEVHRMDADRPLPRTDERLLQADLHRGDRDETLIVRPAGERYAVRIVRRGAGPGLLVTRTYLATDVGRPLRFQTAWGPGPARAEGDFGWAPLLTRFVGFGGR